MKVNVMANQILNQTNAGKGVLILVVVALLMTGIGMVQDGYKNSNYITVIIGLLVVIVGVVVYMFKAGYFGPKPEDIDVDEAEKKMDEVTDKVVENVKKVEKAVKDVKDEI